MDKDGIVLKTEGLCRSYIKYSKEEGLRGSLKSLFRRRRIEVQAVRDFNLELRRGEILGLIGPNGAGKTTLVKMLAGIIRRTAGIISVLGHDPAQRREAYLSRMAIVMGQKSLLWWDLPARDSFLLARAIYGLDAARYRVSLDRLCGALDAGGLIDLPVRGLSLGERMKMEFICAMLHEPEIAFLDEPTIGLDAPAQKAIREFVRSENARRGMGVILTSHYMEDVRRLCGRVAVIVRGRKTYDGGLEGLFASVRERKRLIFSFSAETSVDRLLLAGADVLVENPYRLELLVPSQSARSVLAAVLSAHDTADVAVEEEEMADSVEKIYAREAGRE